MSTKHSRDNQDISRQDGVRTTRFKDAWSSKLTIAGTPKRAEKYYYNLVKDAFKQSTQYINSYKFDFDDNGKSEVNCNEILRIEPRNTVVLIKNIPSGNGHLVHKTLKYIGRAGRKYNCAIIVDTIPQDESELDISEQNINRLE